MMKLARLSAADGIYSAGFAVACLCSYGAATYALSGVVDQSSDYLGGMWATVATVFVFKNSRPRVFTAVATRFAATCVSFALCLLYFCLLPFTPVGMAAVLGAGTAVMMALGRRDDITTTGITTTVVMVVGAMNPRLAWTQPLLRLFDTVVGMAVGVGVNWVELRLVQQYAGVPPLAKPGVLSRD